jgi:hypothetical protein
MILKYFSSPPASQLLVANCWTWWAFSTQFGYCFLEIRRRTVPSFSDSSGPVNSLLPEDNGREGHNLFQEEIFLLGGTFCHAYAKLKTTSLRFVRFRYWMRSSLWLIVIWLHKLYNILIHWF